MNFYSYSTLETRLNIQWVSWTIVTTPSTVEINYITVLWISKGTLNCEKFTLNFTNYSWMKTVHTWLNYTQVDSVFFICLFPSSKQIIWGFELTPTYVNPTGWRVNCTNRLPIQILIYTMIFSTLYHEFVCHVEHYSVELDT